MPARRRRRAMAAGKRVSVNQQPDEKPPDARQEGDEDAVPCATPALDTGASWAERLADQDKHDPT
jgi:hypothetical protein